MFTIHFSFKTSTQTCYRFETGERPDQMTLYLKKDKVDAAGIDPKKGITIMVEQTNE